MKPWDGLTMARIQKMLKRKTVSDGLHWKHRLILKMQFNHGKLDVFKLASLEHNLNFLSNCS